MLDSGGVRARLIVRANGGVLWRLMAGNGRGLGISAAEFDDGDAAADALEAAMREAGSLTPHIAHPTSSLTWTWVARDQDGVAVVRAERSFARYGTCLSSFTRLRDTLAGAVPVDVSELSRTGR